MTTTSTTTSTRVQGDVNDTIVYRLSGVENLNTVTAVEAHVWKGTTRATLAAAVTDPIAREVTVQCGDAAGWLATTTTAGIWLIELELTFGDGRTNTWPASPAIIQVRAQGDAPTP